MNFASCIVN